MENHSNILELKELWRRVNGQVRPVIIRSTNEEFPYSGVGTAFILEYKNQLFIVSAQHVVVNQGAKNEEFTIFIGNPCYSLIFDLEAVFQTEYEPHFDLLIRRIAPFQRDLLIDKGAYWIGTEFTIDPKHHQNVDIFYVFGYSEDYRAYDYEAKRISASLSCLPAKLANSNLEHMVSLQLLQTPPFSLRGFSGSPVIAVIDNEWMFAGMLTLAVASTGALNFIPAYRILRYLQQLDEKI